MDQPPPHATEPPGDNVSKDAVSNTDDDPDYTEEALSDLRDFEEIVARNWPQLPRLLDPLKQKNQLSPRSVVDTPFEVESGQVRIGRYNILRILGEGGGGVVALASDTVLGRRVALKIPGTKALVSASARRRFITEARAAARLRHPNVVAIHDAEDAGAFCYFVMDYWPGGSLAEWLASQPPGQVVPPRHAAALTIGIAQGIQHAHDQGILHRDLKPGNILLAQEQEVFDSIGFRPMVADFGLAKILDEPPDSNATLSGEPLGTLAYMAPEQVRGDLNTISPATDVYGLGAILYELITRQRPHAGLTRAQRIEQGNNERVEPPRRFNKLIPVDLETICLKCLEPGPTDRYQAASEVANELKRYLSSLPILAHRHSLMGRLRRKIKRQPRRAVALSLVVLVAAIVFNGLDRWWSRDSFLVSTEALGPGNPDPRPDAELAETPSTFRLVPQLNELIENGTTSQRIAASLLLAELQTSTVENAVSELFQAPADRLGALISAWDARLTTRDRSLLLEALREAALEPPTAGLAPEEKEAHDQRCATAAAALAAVGEFEPALLLLENQSDPRFQSLLFQALRSTGITPRQLLELLIGSQKPGGDRRPRHAYITPLDPGSLPGRDRKSTR